MAKKQEKKSNGFSTKALIGTVAILAAALLSLVLFDSFVPFRHGGPDDFMSIMLVTGSLSFLIVVFSAVLIYTYLKDYFELKSSFTLALLLAIISFLMFGISSNPMVRVFFGAYDRPGFFNFLPYIFAALALGILTWISRE